MPKRIHPLLKQKASTRSETRVLVDPLYPEDEVEITLRACSILETQKASDLAEEMIRKYLNPKKGEDKLVLTVRDPKENDPNHVSVIELTENIIHTIAMTTVMQVPENDTEESKLSLYSFEELAAMSVTYPSVFIQLVSWASALQNDHSRTLKNELRVEGEQPSE
jgi:hypothetical protein